MEEIERLREESRKQQEEIRVLREENARLNALVEELLPLKRQIEELERRGKEQGERIEVLSQENEALQDRIKKDSHNSSLPPSSDRFSRQKKSLRKKSGRSAGGQEGHEGKTLCQVSEPDEVIVERVEKCEHCQHDLQREPVRASWNDVSSGISPQTG